MKDSEGGLNLSIAVPWILTLVTLVFGVWKFAAESSQANRRPFLEKQLSVSFEASETVATLATTTDTELWKTARERFWILYWGQLSIVEDKAVEAAMTKLGRAVPKPGEAVPDLPLSELQTLSYQLAHSIRLLLLRSWDVDLPALDNSKAR